MKLLSLWCSVLLLLLAGCSDSKPDLKDGKWQITAKVAMAGVPFTMPPMIYEECLSQDDIIPTADSGCELQEPTIDGNTVSWVSICTESDGTVATNKGVITYAGETFSGKLHMEITGDKPMSAENTLSGRYLGDCDKE